MHAGQVDGPATVVLELIRHAHDRVETGEMLEERIARLRDQYFIARIAQQLEQHRVRVAGADGQHDALGGDDDVAPSEVVGNGLSRGQRAHGLGPVGQPAGIGQRGQQIVRVDQLCVGRIRLREIDVRPVLPVQPSPCFRQRVLVQVGRNAPREHHGRISTLSITSPSMRRSTMSMPFRTCANTV